jgi:hypothetical protein
VPRRRAVKILLFPVIAPILLIGYMLYLVGDSKARTIKRTAAPVAKLHKSKTDNLKMGLMQELTESQTIST